MQSRGNRAFSFYLVGQGISNLGEAFRFIAITILIYKLTGSGMEAAAGLALSALPSIITSPFAGVLGDRMNERRLLILIDFIRFLIVPLVLLADNVLIIYLLLILLSFSDIFYNPSRRKFILGMTGKEGALKANSSLTGISGGAYLVGPLAAGFLTDTYGTAPAILAASVCCLFSCFLTFASAMIYEKTAPDRKINQVGAKKAGVGYNAKTPVIASMLYEFKKGLKYSKSSPDVKSLLAIGFAAGFCSISINLTFYPYAFDLLRVTARGWSVMVTIYYGTNLLAMLLLKYIGTFVKKHSGSLFYGGLCIVSVIWSLYSTMTDFGGVLLLQFIEGTVMAACGILLSARFQIVTEKSFMARVSGLNDIASNAGRLLGLGCTLLLTSRLTYLAVFIVNGAVLFSFAVHGILRSRWARLS